ncbi:MAG: hypothetical protein DRP06_03580 [Candidatus Aenigmatarchaeota archaeon]|nr:MAG: hypothetical protein DRP06_03580 [Candidatus Aenigmarchaeota archaeon]
MKAQASVEFLVLVGILSLIFVIIFSSSGGYYFYSEKMKVEEKYNNICSTVKLEIETALEIGPYYNRTFYLDSGDHTVSIQNYEVVVKKDDLIKICHIPINISANLNNGENTIIYNETGISFM